MSYITEIFERSTLKEITSFLLTGARTLSGEEDNRDFASGRKTVPLQRNALGT